MTIDPQKEALYAEVTRRAGLYGKLFALQRNDAAPSEIDAALAALGACESEIRRMSDEVNDRIWYRNYEQQAERYTEERAAQHRELLAAIREGAAETKKLATTQRAQGRRIAAIERVLKQRPGERKKEHQALLDGQSGIASQVRDVMSRLDTDEQRLDRKRQLLEDHERRLRQIEQRLGVEQAETAGDASD